MDSLENEQNEPIRVLYVDDDESFADKVQTKLSNIDSNIDVTLSSDIETALERVTSQSIDCVVTTYSLGAATGLDLVDAVRERAAPLPTILLTKQRDGHVTAEAASNNASDHITLQAERDNFSILATRVETLVSAVRNKQRAVATTNRFRRTLERTTDAIYAVNSDWEIEYMNQKMADRVGCDPDSVVGAILWEEFPSIAGTELETRYRTAVETGEPVSFEQYLGPPFDYWVEVRAFPDDDGLTVFSREITEERERERELQRSKAILENVHDVVFVIDSSMEIQYANPSAARARSGPDALRGMNILDIMRDSVSDEDYERFREAVRETLSGMEDRSDGGPTGLYDFDLQMTADTTFGRRAFDVRLAPLYDATEKQVLIVARDVTERYEAQQQLEQERDALQAVQRVMGNATLSTDERLTKLLEIGCQTLGLDLGVVSNIDGNDYEIRAIHPTGGEISVGDRFDLGSTYCKEVVENDEVCSFIDAVDAGYESHPAYQEFGLKAYIGAPLTVDGERYGTVNFSSSSTRKTPFGEFERTLVELLGELVSAELSRDRSRTELEQTNRRLESLIETAPMAIMEVGRRGNLLLWNQGAEEMFGWSREEVIGTFNPLVPDEKIDEYESHLAKTFAGERVYGKEIRRQTKAGDKLDLLLSTASIADPEGGVDRVIAILEDITPQKRIERSLRELQQTAQELTVASSTEEVGEIAVEAAVDVLGLEVTSIWEYDEQEDALVPLTETSAARDLYGETPTLTAGESLAWESFESGEIRVYDDVRQHDGRYNKDTEMRSEIIVPLGRHGLLLTGSTSSREFTDRDTDLFRILAASAEAAMVRAKRENELRRQNERLDEFADVVAHDLRNPLTVASGFLDIAAETGNEQYFDRVRSAHERIENLIEDLLTLSRGERPIDDSSEIDLEKLAEESWGYVNTDKANLSLSESLPTVHGDANRLKHLFENLFRNAIEHGGGDVNVTVEELADGSGFAVEDDGVGISPERQADVFDHGVSYSDDGTGFGLSIVAAIAREHGWSVSVTDGADGGARFEFESERSESTEKTAQTQ
ncbi:PAS domain S-box protein [Haloferax mediterranei ATCC 33500]|uniref:histidine kinase n=1 Tax=Haloferax mediterranei (strain ATCC 33500 / DSM 1411 / JCM 8866 / NBRC 14739 / NCIMB 2177 / R-4) TaxID=523841 RepID=I3R4V4_HALMT|nr:PAS domain-containing protein [Haloferax mediterranei]AFK19264.1 light and oxygen sensing histidine kinase [Haloferax mediterranei ATCC 33500]AHZ21377.1 histidine kinase [Haloferax mediterranei ATCC 33500]EMA04547.1 light and oxygen sensing histidine kinase [Haloferax mediterranei ATCC 33500]MDX5989367.1 PAS domain-containing protein [Haloferax mediterranei ATCC 33500]QCQ75731.1 PAS domain S-box protein [Haloferax mediterranei ATCC 33500]